ncbi:MAG: flagellar filament outer layer protein FlaA [Treponema sp.]|nr:flagellar filament outer layer protein FlaA [Treponema sp.]
MKYGSIKTVCLVVLACIVVLSAYADDRTVDLNSIVIAQFNGETSMGWREGKYLRNYEFSWALGASRFATKTEDEDGNEVNFPRMAYIDAWPVTIFGYNPDEPQKSLGIHGRFDRKGYNWIDIYPVASDGTTPFEIRLPGRVRFIDVWVWGANLNYNMEAYVRDHMGIVHRINLGSINHTGWRNLRATIPNHIQQAKRVLPNLAQMRFVKFRIETQPTERVDDFYIYLKQFKVVTDTFESLFDGDDLADPDRVPGLWANSTN